MTLYLWKKKSSTKGIILTIYVTKVHSCYAVERVEGRATECHLVNEASRIRLDVGKRNTSILQHWQYNVSIADKTGPVCCCDTQAGSCDTRDYPTREKRKNNEHSQHRTRIHTRDSQRTRYQRGMSENVWLIQTRSFISSSSSTNSIVLRYLRPSSSFFLSRSGLLYRSAFSFSPGSFPSFTRTNNTCWSPVN